MTTWWGKEGIFRVFLQLGLTSFGGPVAHISYFHLEFVQKRKWLTEKDFADLVSLSQFLPGPSSSQVGIGIGALRGGWQGVLAAWLGFTLPSAMMMIFLGMGMTTLTTWSHAGWLHGLKIAAVAIVAGAVWSMAKQLCPERISASIAIVAAGFALAIPGVVGQLGCIVLGALSGALLIKRPPITEPQTQTRFPISHRLAVSLLFCFLVLFIGLPWLATISDWNVIGEINGFFRSGSLIFGGGHVVLPLLQAEFVPTGWVDKDIFLAGYGAAQALPGPLLTFSGFLGAVMRLGPGGWPGGMIAVVAIFLPSLLLVPAALPFWDTIRRREHVQTVLAGINAAVVGLLLAALYHPVWTAAIISTKTFILALVTFGLLQLWKITPWILVIGSAVAGELLIN